MSAPGVDLGGNVGAQSISIHLQGLQAGTTYHYSFVAVQDGEVFAEPDRVFSMQSGGASDGSGALPDGRAWEMVSPPNKGGALLELTRDGGQVQAASDGSAITYIGKGPSIDHSPEGNLTYAQILSRRGAAGGWSSQDLTLPNRLPEDGVPAEELFQFSFNYHLFSPDLSLAMVEPQALGTPPLAPGASERTLYIRDNTNGVFSPLVTPANVPEGTKIDSESLTSGDPDSWQLHFLADDPRSQPRHLQDTRGTDTGSNRRRNGEGQHRKKTQRGPGKLLSGICMSGVKVVCSL